jgi:hypothetical protein
LVTHPQTKFYCEPDICEINGLIKPTFTKNLSDLQLGHVLASKNIRKILKVTTHTSSKILLFEIDILNSKIDF